jgi:ComF family protein
VTAAIERLLNALLELVAPPECVACESRSAAPLCERCGALVIAPAPRSLAGVPVLAALGYAPPFDGVLRRFKYQGRPDLAPRLAELLPGSSMLPGHTLVPVPLHPRRLAERGYNQAALLANALARRGGLRVQSTALCRLRDTPRQARLPRAERLRNVEAAFQARRPEALTGSRVVLVDDVVTTGATALACIGSLRRAGARVSAVLAAASAEA